MGLTQQSGDLAALPSDAMDPCPHPGHRLPPTLLPSRRALHTVETCSHARGRECYFKYFFCSLLSFPPGIHVTHMLHFS